QDLWIQSVVSLPHENSRHPRAPDLLDGGQDAELVVHNDIMSRRIPLFHIGQLVLLVDVNQRVPLDRFIKPGAVHLTRLEDDVAVSEKDSCSPMLNVLNHVERVGEEAVGKGIVYEESRNGQQTQVVRVLASVTLQGAQIVGV